MINMPNLSLDSDFSYFDSKIEGKKRYIESMKKEAALEFDSARVQWFDSIIENMTDMLDLLTYCKKKLEMKAGQTSSRRIFSANSSPPSTSTSHDSALSNSSLGNKTSPLSSPARGFSNASPVLSPLRTSTVDDATQALRLAENKQSIIFMNIAESTAFDPADKQSSDLADVQKILELIGISAHVQNVTRFSPKSLPIDRPPFLKVRFSSEEEKKQVLPSIISNISRLRSSLGGKFAEITVTDPARSVQAGNNSRSNAVSKFGSLSSTSAGRQSLYAPAPLASPPAFGQRALSSSAFGQGAFSSSAYRHGVSQTSALDKAASASTYGCPVSSTSDYPSTFGSRASSNANATRFEANYSSQVNSSPATEVQPHPETGASDDRSPLKSCMKRSVRPTARSRCQEMFSSPTKLPRSKSVQAPRARYTQARSDGVYTTDDEEF